MAVKKIKIIIYNPKIKKNNKFDNIKLTFRINAMSGNVREFQFKCAILVKG